MTPAKPVRKSMQCRQFSNADVLVVHARKNMRLYCYACAVGMVPTTCEACSTQACMLLVQVPTEAYPGTNHVCAWAQQPSKQGRLLLLLQLSQVPAWSVTLQYHLGSLQFIQDVVRIFASIFSFCSGILDRLLQQLDLHLQQWC